jgi:hypothetical protein
MSQLLICAQPCKKGLLPVEGRDLDSYEEGEFKDVYVV